MAEPFSYSAWLVPARPLRDLLANVIGELGKRFGTPAFTPHATLCSGKWEGGLDGLKQRVDTLSSALQPMTLATHGIDCGGKRTTFFYLRLDRDQAAPLLTQATRALVGSHAPGIGAHLSLMYADPNAAIDRKRLAHELADRMPQQIDFDELQLVTPVGTVKDTDQWQTQYVVRLAEAGS